MVWCFNVFPQHAFLHFVSLRVCILSYLSAFSHNASADLVAWLPEFSSHACQAATEHFSHGGRGMDQGGSRQDRGRVSRNQGGSAAARCASCTVAGPPEELGQEAQLGVRVQECVCCILWKSNLDQQVKHSLNILYRLEQHYFHRRKRSKGVTYLLFVTFVFNMCSRCQDSLKFCWCASGQSVWRWHQCAGSHGPNLEHFQDRHVLSFMFNIFWQRRIVKIKNKMLNHFYKFLSGFSFNSLQDPTCAEMPPFGHPRHSWFRVADLQLHK